MAKDERSSKEDDNSEKTMEMHGARLLGKGGG